MHPIHNRFMPGFQTEDTSNDASWILLFTDNMLLMGKTQDQYHILTKIELKDILKGQATLHYIGSYQEHDCYCGMLKEAAPLPEHIVPVNIREITKLTGDSGLFFIAGTANHLLHWNSINQYCGRCGNKTEDKKDERAKLCPSCGNIIYPRISPATITAVFRGDQILLAHNSHFKENLYSLIAGFVEPGETLEHCVEREIREEVGIKVKNIQYWGSQPWSFPDSLMLAFTAEYDSGEITVDNCEILDAAWFNADSLPDIPSTDSIAGKIIRWYKDKE